MFSIQDRPLRLCDSWSRRELLCAGGATALGLSLPDLLAAETSPFSPPPQDRMFGRAKNVIYLYLQGGPPQHETFDPKPDAPVEIRGEHRPISTNIPGIQFCELLPRTARIADKLAVIRSLSTDDNIHSSSGYWVLTGYKYRGANARTIQPTDWPYFGSIVKMLKPSETMPPLSTVWIPDMMRLNESVTPAGQTAGFLGSRWHPDRFVGDPASPHYEVEGIKLDGIAPLRFDRRRSLLGQVDRHFAAAERGDAPKNYDAFQQQAYDLMTSGAARKAFDISAEPDHVRDRYGRYTWGQSVLLARRLIEAGVRLVHVNWPREPGDNAVDNPLWDTHAQNADRLEDVLCPKFDVTFTTLIEDLDERGLLDETLVVAVGEFGRTPKINTKGGRDHWGPVFCCALAGAGISGGQVYGQSDREGAYPIQNRVRPGQLTATIFHLLGLNYLASFHDRQDRPNRLTGGEPLFDLLGSAPATADRQPAGGSPARVPPFDRSLLLNTDFADAESLRGFAGPSRPKGWRADPLPAETQQSGWSVGLVRSPDAARMSLDLVPGAMPLSLKAGAQAVLAQEVRSPFAGRYRLSLRCRGCASSTADFTELFAGRVRCRLIFFQFNDRKKSPADRKELASIEFTPQRHDDGPWQTIELEKEFVNPNPGSNFSFGNGLGVAVIVEEIADRSLDVPDTARFAGLDVDRVTLEFIGKQRLEDVTV